MAALSKVRERQIVEALTDSSLPWAVDLFGSSYEIICRLCNCSVHEAREILEKICVQHKAIEAMPAFGKLSESHWRWIVKRG